MTKHEMVDSVMEGFRRSMAERAAAQRALAQQRLPAPIDVSSKAWAERFGPQAAKPQPGIQPMTGAQYGYRGGEVGRG